MMTLDELERQGDRMWRKQIVSLLAQIDDGRGALR